MKYRIKGTIKQKKAVAEALRNGGNISAAMRKAGYSSNTAKTPKKLTGSKGFSQLTEDFLPDRKLLELTAKGLDAVKFYSIPGEAPLIMPDSAVQHKFLELALKIKGYIK